MTDPNVLKGIIETLEFLAQSIITNDERLLELTNALIGQVERLECDVVILRQRLEALESVNGVTH